MLTTKEPVGKVSVGDTSRTSQTGQRFAGVTSVPARLLANISRPSEFGENMITVDKKPPSYLTEHNIIAIQQLTEISEHCKDVFQFYWETGLRLREPYSATIKNGNWLIIDRGNFYIK